MGIYSDFAQRYYDNGLIVLPVDPKSKSCLIKNWNTIFVKDMNQETLDQYIESHGDWNIGLVCGKASNVVVADFDFEGDHSKILENMVLGILPPSPVAKTAEKGWSRFYRPSENIRKIGINRGDKRFMDILADGPSYTVLPPSNHPKEGVIYRWLSLETLLDISSNDLPELTEAHINSIKEIASFDNSHVHEVNFRKSDRNTKLFGFFWKAASTLKDDQELINLVFRFDQTTHSKDPKGPFFEDQKYRKNLSAEEFAVKEVGRWINYRKRQKPGDYEMSAENHPSKANGFFLKIPMTDSKGAPTGKFKEVPDFEGFSKYIGEELYLKANDSFTYMYQDQYYRSISQLQLEHIIRSKVKANTNPQIVGQFLRDAKASNFRPDSYFVEPRGMLNLVNGVFDVKRNELLPHTPELFFKYKLPHGFDESADCPRFKEYLLKILSKDHDLVNLMQEMFGYVLLGGDPWLHKAFIFYGEGRNGKSVVLDVLKKLMGENNFSSVGLKNLEKPFSAILCDGKLANICGECTVDQLASDVFKTCVGGEPVIAAQKGYPEYKFNFQARLIFAANEFPKFKDSTSGMHEKLCIIPFNHYIAEEDRERNFSARFDHELSGILTWSLKGLKRLQKNGRLTTASLVKETLQEYRRESDSVYEWFCEYVRFDAPQANRYLLGSFYDHYVSFCEEGGRYAVQKAVFGRKLRDTFKKYPNVEFHYPHNKCSVSGRIFITAKADWRPSVENNYASRTDN